MFPRKHYFCCKVNLFVQTGQRSSKGYFVHILCSVVEHCAGDLCLPAVYLRIAQLQHHFISLNTIPLALKLHFAFLMAFMTPTPTPNTRRPSCPVALSKRRPTVQMSTLPPRVIPSPLPNLFVYDHCPFCVRVRHALGLKNIKHNLVFLANDDVATPTELIGKKMVPIFQPDGKSGASLGESLDIISAVDSDPRFGEPGMLQKASGRTDIAKWFENVAWPLRRLTRIRFAKAPLPEFTFQDARDTYAIRHPIKQEPTTYEENWERSAEWIGMISEKLGDLEGMIWSKENCTEGGVGFDDVDLFPRIRSMTIVKGLELPQKVREYAEHHAELSEVPLYDYCAM